MPTLDKVTSSLDNDVNIDFSAIDTMHKFSDIPVIDVGNIKPLNYMEIAAEIRDSQDANVTLSSDFFSKLIQKFGEQQVLETLRDWTIYGVVYSSNVGIKSTSIEQPALPTFNGLNDLNVQETVNNLFANKVINIDGIVEVFGENIELFDKSIQQQAMIFSQNTAAQQEQEIVRKNQQLEEEKQRQQQQEENEKQMQQQQKEEERIRQESKRAFTLAINKDPQEYYSKLRDAIVELFDNTKSTEENSTVDIIDNNQLYGLLRKAVDDLGGNIDTFSRSRLDVNYLIKQFSDAKQAFTLLGFMINEKIISSFYLLTADINSLSFEDKLNFLYENSSHNLNYVFNIIQDVFTKTVLSPSVIYTFTSQVFNWLSANNIDSTHGFISKDFFAFITNNLGRKNLFFDVKKDLLLLAQSFGYKVSDDELKALDYNLYVYDNLQKLSMSSNDLLLTKSIIINLLQVLHPQNLLTVKNINIEVKLLCIRELIGVINQNLKNDASFAELSNSIAYLVNDIMYEKRLPLEDKISLLHTMEPFNFVYEVYDKNDNVSKHLHTLNLQIRFHTNVMNVMSGKTADNLLSLFYEAMSEYSDILQNQWNVSGSGILFNAIQQFEIVNNLFNDLYAVMQYGDWLDSQGVQQFLINSVVFEDIFKTIFLQQDLAIESKCILLNNITNLYNKLNIPLDCKKLNISQELLIMSIYSQNNELDYRALTNTYKGSQGNIFAHIVINDSNVERVNSVVNSFLQYLNDVNNGADFDVNRIPSLILEMESIYKLLSQEDDRYVLIQQYQRRFVATYFSKNFTQDMDEIASILLRHSDDFMTAYSNNMPINPQEFHNVQKMINKALLSMKSKDARYPRLHQNSIICRLINNETILHDIKNGVSAKKIAVRASNIVAPKVTDAMLVTEDNIAELKAIVSKRELLQGVNNDPFMKAFLDQLKVALKTNAWFYSTNKLIQMFTKSFNVGDFARSEVCLRKLGVNVPEVLKQMNLPSNLKDALVSYTNDLMKKAENTQQKMPEQKDSNTKPLESKNDVLLLPLTTGAIDFVIYGADYFIQRKTTKKTQQVVDNDAENNKAEITFTPLDMPSIQSESINDSKNNPVILQSQKENIMLSDTIVEIPQLELTNIESTNQVIKSNNSNLTDISTISTKGSVTNDPVILQSQKENIMLSDTIVEIPQLELTNIESTNQVIKSNNSNLTDISTISTKGSVTNDPVILQSPVKKINLSKIVSEAFSLNNVMGLSTSVILSLLGAPPLYSIVSGVLYSGISNIISPKNNPNEVQNQEITSDQSVKTDLDFSDDDDDYEDNHNNILGNFVQNSMVKGVNNTPLQLEDDLVKPEQIIPEQSNNQDNIESQLVESTEVQQINIDSIVGPNTEPLPDLINNELPVSNNIVEKNSKTSTVLLTIHSDIYQALFALKENLIKFKTESQDRDHLLQQESFTADLYKNLNNLERRVSQAIAHSSSTITSDFYQELQAIRKLVINQAIELNDVRKLISKNEAQHGDRFVNNNQHILGYLSDRFGGYISSASKIMSDANKNKAFNALQNNNSIREDKQSSLDAETEPKNITTPRLVM